MKILERIKNCINKIINIANNIVNIIISGIKHTINFVAKNVNNIIIWAFLTAISLGAINYFVNMPIDYEINAMSEYKDYIVNKRSLKIHIEICPSVSKMREKNKLKTNDTLEHLINNGYFICNRCKAGIKRKNENVASALESIENLLFGDKDAPLKSYDEYLNSIDEMGQWYVEHIATYETSPDDIATESAKEYYKNNKIDKRGDIYLYSCDNLKDCTGEYTKAGDDCVRFLFSCLNNMDNNFINLLSKYSKYKWSSISSNILNERKDQLQYTLTNMGFEIYDIEPEKVDLNGDKYFEFEIYPIDTNFKLQKGDILSRDGHIHIYLSENENFGWGKVNNVYPQTTLTYIDSTTNVIICNGESFNRVYRYIGEK